jgi:hypothetical protein
MGLLYFVSTITVNGINTLEFDRHLNAAVDVRTFVAQNNKKLRNFVIVFPQHLNLWHRAFYTCVMCSVMLKTQSISVHTSSLVHPPSKFHCSVYQFGYLIVPRGFECTHFQ